MRDASGPVDPRSPADQSLSTRRAPVLVHVVPTAAEAVSFPVEALDEVRPRADRLPVGLAIGAVGGLAVLVLLAAGTVLSGTGVKVAVGVAFALCLVAGGLLYYRGHWAGWLVACWGAVVGALVADAWAAGVVAVLVLAGLAFLARRGDAAREGWWPLLERMARAPRPYAGTLVGVQRTSRGGALVSDAWLTVEAPDLPGRTWGALAVAEKGFSPQVGDPVVVWTNDDVPVAAVIVIAVDAQRAAQGR